MAFVGAFGHDLALKDSGFGRSSRKIQQDF